MKWLMRVFLFSAKESSMHPKEIIDAIVVFEEDLAAFYQRLENDDHFKPMREVLQFMHKHSAIHAQLIRNYRAEVRLPQLSLQPLQTLHDRIKTVLNQQLMASTDLSEVSEKLAQAEAIISRAYAVIADYFDETADMYAKLGQKLKNLSKDEMQHHDQLLKQKPGEQKDTSLSSTD